MKVLLVEDESLYKKYFKDIPSDLDRILQKFHYGEIEESVLILIIKMILNSRELGPKYAHFLNHFISAIKEFKKHNIIATDYWNTNNWGRKNGHIGFFDLGDGKDEKQFDIPVTEAKNEGDDDIIDNLALNVMEKMGIENFRILGGENYGRAYDIGGDKVLKITTDISEANNSYKIKGKKLKYIADVYNVYKTTYEGKDFYIIILEKLNTFGVRDYIRMYDEIDVFIFNHIFKKYSKYYA